MLEKKKKKGKRRRDGFPVICLRYVHRVQCNMLMPKHDKRSVVVPFVLDKSIAKVNHLLKVELSSRDVGRSWAYLKSCIANFSPWQMPCSVHEEPSALKSPLTKFIDFCIELFPSLTRFFVFCFVLSTPQKGRRAHVTMNG
jgi:hypothetical protein